jgi:hypothetical protein
MTSINTNIRRSLEQYGEICFLGNHISGLLLVDEFQAFLLHALFAVVMLFVYEYVDDMNEVSFHAIEYKKIIFFLFLKNLLLMKLEILE